MTFPPNEVSAVVREQANQGSEGQRACGDAGPESAAQVVPEFYGTGSIGHDRVIGACGARGTVVLRSFRADPDDDFGEEDDGESLISIDPGSLDALLAFVQNAIVARNAKRRDARVCVNCGKPGSHFAPPSMGEPGLFICEKVEEKGAALAGGCETSGLAKEAAAPRVSDSSAVDWKSAYDAKVVELDKVKNDFARYVLRSGVRDCVDVMTAKSGPVAAHEVFENPWCDAVDVSRDGGDNAIVRVFVRTCGGDHRKCRAIAERICRMLNEESRVSAARAREGAAGRVPSTEEAASCGGGAE